MKKPFVPFDKFERGCLPDSKPLHESMQENCNDRLAPTPEPCHYTCVPYWQPTGNRRCLDIGVVEIEEADGCGNTRFTRIAERVVWEDNDETDCDEARNRIRKQQVNQCGDTRWVTTSELCCTPEWQPPVQEELNCDQSVVRKREYDGCGNARWVTTAIPVNWESTGEDRCQPGDIHEVEQINQCGETRWLAVGSCNEDIEISPNISAGHCINRTVEEAGYRVGMGIRLRPDGSCQYHTAENPVKAGTWYTSLAVNPNDYEVRFTGTATGPGTSTPGVWYVLNLDRFFYNEQTLTSPNGATWIEGTLEIRNRHTGVIVFSGPIKAVNSRSETPGYCDAWPDVPPSPPGP